MRIKIRLKSLNVGKRAADQRKWIAMRAVAALFLAIQRLSAEVPDFPPAAHWTGMYHKPDSHVSGGVERSL